MKFKLLIINLFLSMIIYSQNEKDILLQKNIVSLVEEMEFMFGYDQALREYIVYKTFDKSEIDRIEKLSDNLKIKEMSQRKFESDIVGTLIWKNYINPKDAEHTKRLIEITKTYGFPSVNRIQQYYKKEFIDPEFNPLIILIHSPKEFWEQLKELMKNEYQNGTINKYQYGYLLWHFTGRKSFKPMLDNGFEMVKENGISRLKSTCE
jgi:hypothetical protein